MQYPSYVFAETLRDGTAVTVRAAGANDGPKIRRAFLNLERDTVYTRSLVIRPMSVTPNSVGLRGQISSGRSRC